MQVLYIDMLFFLNTVMNYFIFRITSVLGNYKIKHYRVVIAALLSSMVYCAAVIVPILRQIPMQIYQLFIPIAAIIYLFRCVTLRDFLKKWLLTQVVAWGIGGIAFNLCYVVDAATHNQHIKPWIPISAAVVLFLLIEWGYTEIRRKMIEPHYTYEMELVNKNRSTKIQGYLDTGNCLYTLTHQPVILSEHACVETIISETYKKVLDGCKKGDIQKYLMSIDDLPKLYLIPYTSVGCEEDLLVGIPIEKMIIGSNKNQKVIENGVVGVCFHPLFKDGRYQALIHPDLLL